MPHTCVSKNIDKITVFCYMLVLLLYLKSTLGSLLAEVAGAI